MPSIVFERRPGVYLPEISAYIEFIKKHCADITPFDSFDIEEYDPRKYDVSWRWMGLDIASDGNRIVHEYGSLSTGRFPHIKNQIKKTLNKKPFQRVFLNEIVEEDFSFKDNVPSYRRDMGVSDLFYKDYSSVNKEYDFVYAGTLCRGKIIEQVLDYFAEHITDATLLLVGDAHNDLLEKYKAAENIKFTGRVKYEEVPALMAKAHYGLNLMPDIYPLNIQTATKVLEYCALGLPVVSTDYQWIRIFEANEKGRFFYLDKDLTNLSLRDIKKHPFKVPNVDHYNWDSIIYNSGIFNFLSPKHIRSV